MSRIDLIVLTACVAFSSMASAEGPTTAPTTQPTSQPATAVAVAPTTQPSDATKYVISHVFRVGEKRMLALKMLQESQFGFGGDPNMPPRQMKVEGQLDMELNVSKGENAADKRVSTEFRRMRMKSDFGEQTHDVDSDNPAKNGEDIGEATLLIGMTFYADLDQAGKIIVFDIGLDSLFAKITQAGENMPSPDAKESMKQELTRAFRGIIESPIALLPSGPVAVGETWQAKWCPPLSSPQDYDMQCKLERIEQAKTGPVAVISLNGKAAAADDDIPDLIGEAKFDLTGKEFIECVAEAGKVDDQSSRKQRITITLSPVGNAASTTQPAATTTAPAGAK